MATPSFLIDVSAGDTPQSVAKKRAMIQAMMQPYGKASNIGEGFAQLMNGIATGAQNRALDKAERAGNASAATALENIYRGLSGTQAPLGQGPFPDAPKQSSYSSEASNTAPNYRASLIGTESGGNFAARNNEIGAGGKAGHFGRVQFGQARFAEAKAAGAVPQGMTIQDFAKDTPEGRAAQVSAENWHFEDLERKLSPYVGSNVNGQNLDLGSLVAMGHLGGAGGAEKYVKTGGRYNPSDSFGTSLADYAKKHAGKSGGGTQVASLDPSIGMKTAYAPEQQQQPMYVGQVQGGQISTAVERQAPQPQPVQPPQQTDTQAPQGQSIDAGTPFERQGQSQGMDLNMLMQQAQNPWLDDASRQFVNGLIEREMQKQDPAYQMQQQQAQIGLQKSQLELQKMQNPAARIENVGGRLVEIGPDGSVKEAYAPPPEPTKPAPLPAGIQEYEYAKNQGFGGTFQDWEASKKGGMAITTNPDGTMTFQQGNNIKPMTEAQSKDTVYSTRAEGSLPLLDQYADSLTEIGGNTIGQLPFIGNALKSENFQKGEQAANEFLQAILRKDTGAAITEGEQALYGNTYIPRMGDKPGVLAQKKAARFRALQGMKAGMTPQAIIAQEQALQKSGNTPMQQPTQAAPDFSKMSDAELEAIINGQ